jgi:nucleotidyltransferase/DNA polymerase involved in DNA repair
MMGRRFHQWAHGTYESEVSEGKRVRKSLGHESTFATNTGERDVVLQRLEDICRSIYERTLKRNLLFKTITVKVRYGDFETHTHGTTLPFYTDQSEDLEKVTRELIRPYLDRNERVRLIGVRVSSLKSSKGQEILS